MNACKVLELAINNDILKIIEFAKQEIAENTIKEKHGANNLKRFKLIVKYLKCSGRYSTKYGNTWIEDDLQCFTNGYTAFLLKNHFDELPISEEKFINLHEYIKKGECERQLADFDVADVKTKIKIFKAERKDRKNPCYYELGESRYNAQYLIDCYMILGGENIKFYQPKNGELIPSIFESENGKAIISPVKKPKQNQ